MRDYWDETFGWFFGTGPLSIKADLRNGSQPNPNTGEPAVLTYEVPGVEAKDVEVTHQSSSTGGTTYIDIKTPKHSIREVVSGQVESIDAELKLGILTLTVKHKPPTEVKVVNVKT